MRTLILASALAFTSAPAIAGEAPYNPHPTSQQQLLDACSRDVMSAQAGLSTNTHAANRPKAEEYLKEARAAMKAGDATTCYNRVQDALHWEQ